MRKIAYLGMDVHVSNSVLGEMDAAGHFRGNRSFTTCEKNIIKALKDVKAKEKYLTIEEGALSYWVAQVAAPYVTEVISCNPIENALIYKSPHKRDKVDTQKLCRLLRMGELKQVYHPENDHRAIFKAAARHYMDLRGQHKALKQKIKAMYRYWGIVGVQGLSVYSSKGREDFLKLVKHRHVRNQLHRLYFLMDQAGSMREHALTTMKQMGRKYPEIKEFMKIHGIGEVGAHIFDALIQTPHRFPNKRKLWRYCRLGVTDRSSDGKQLGYRRLDKSGVSELKAISYQAWMVSMKGENEVSQFYMDSLKRTQVHVHARLNTQRKILSTMYGLWKSGESYDPQKFLEPPQNGAA
jgi:transposase